jgi:DNA-binding response OmpR family regulator
MRYQVSTGCREGMKAVLAFEPDVVILGADPPQLDCCDLLSEIKGSEHTRNIRVVMLSPGGPAERTRGLDLGADDVLSLPFDPQELRSRVRSQLRNKSIADESQERLRLAESNRSATQQVATAVNEERRTLRVGGLATAAVLVVAALAFLFSYRRTQEQNTRVYAAITRLQAGVLTQQQLMERSRRALQDRDHGPSPASDPQKLELQKKSEDLRSQIAIDKTENASALQDSISRGRKPPREDRDRREVCRENHPAHTMMDRSMTFCNSRMFPGQGYDSSNRRVFLSTVVIVLPAFRA